MSGGRNRDRNRGSGPSRTEVPSPGVIREIIQGDDPEKLVKNAENIGKGLAENEELKTHQIRSLFTEVRRIADATQRKSKLSSADRRRLVMIKPKLAYQARRQIESGRNYGVATLEKVLKPAIESVGDDVKHFQNFVDFFEAILAYHKNAGGRE